MGRGGIEEEGGASHVGIITDIMFFLQSGLLPFSFLCPTDGGKEDKKLIWGRQRLGGVQSEGENVSEGLGN